MNHECTACGGEGQVRDDEDPRGLLVACYHCCETGLIITEQVAQDEMRAKAAVRAIAEVRARREGNDEWDLCAAENGMSGSDYARMLMLDLTEKYLSEMAS